MFPSPIKDLIDQLSRLPEIGPRAATRLVFHLLYQDQKELEQLADSMKNLKKNTRLCQRCFNVADKDNSLCPICLDKKRDQSLVCLVENILDVLPIERTKQYHGTYHILGGLICPADGLGPDNLRIKELVQRIKKDDVKEVILALNPTTEGDTTALYLERVLKPCHIAITRLGRGLSVGSDLEYIDESTLSSALRNRR